MQHRQAFALVLLGTLCCGGCGKKAPSLAGGKPVHYWIEALQNGDTRLRKQAAFKLGNVGPADAEALPALTTALKDRDAVVRCEVILALLKCGPEAAKAVPALQDLQQHDPHAQVRRYAAKAVEKLGN